MAKLTKEQVKFFIETITDNMYNTTQHKIAETLLSKFDECESLQAKLLAYEQAAKNPIGSFHISGGQVEATTDYCRDGEWPVQDGEVLVYAAPVLPKQPELVEKLKKVMNSWLAMEPKLAFQPEFTDVMMLLDAEPAHAQPVIPEQNDLSEKLIGLANHIASAANGIPSGWQDWADEIVTDLRSLASTAQPVSEPYKLNCWSCGNSFTYTQRLECDGYCPHCDSPIDLDEDEEALKAVPLEPTKEMVSMAWREAAGKCDHETIKRIYVTMISAAPAQESE